jgi:RNA polymerase sigma factor (sigma-70 family)
MASLERNSNITESELRALHQEVFRWALYCADFNHEQAKDAVQQTYLKIVEGTAYFGGKSSLKTWLFGVVRLTTRELRRGQERYVADAIEEADDLPDELETLADATLGDDDLGNVDPEAVERALNELSLLQREIVYLVFYRDMPLSEIALVFDVSIGTVRKQYHRAKARLAGLLEAGDEGGKARINGGMANVAKSYS